MWNIWTYWIVYKDSCSDSGFYFYLSGIIVYSYAEIYIVIRKIINEQKKWVKWNAKLSFGEPE